MPTKVKIKKTMFRNGPRVEKLLGILLQRRSENNNNPPQENGKNYWKE